MTVTQDREETELEKLKVEVSKLIEETRKIWEEWGKIRIERIFYPLVAGAAIFGAGAAFVKVFL